MWIGRCLLFVEEVKRSGGRVERVRRSWYELFSGGKGVRGCEGREGGGGLLDCWSFQALLGRFQKYVLVFLVF